MKELSERNHYYIPKERYLELKHFCLQYESYQEYVKYLTEHYNAFPNVRTGSISKPVENLVMNKIATQDKIFTIQDCCMKTDPSLAKWICLGVTKGMPYETLKLMYDIPCSRGTYYRAYRKFFYLLDQARN